MTTTIRAVYQGGVLRPEQPLPLAEGETVEITLNRPIPAAPPLTPAEEEAIRRIREAKTVEEWAAAADALPTPDDGYDLLEALNENRRLSGERLLFLPESEGEPT
jgi:predicted DNA-binding antitoxin AbrB/MazE fold protein